MTIDVLIKNGTLVDGTGAPARRADVAINDGRIVGIGDVDDTAARTVDADGLVVAPGFVDLHTHYDAQLLWDATASPSPLHGVTTVFGGNCGFTLAPGGDAHVDYLSRLMARVEGIPLPALQQGVPWDWKTFADYLDRVEHGGIAVNAGFLCGHSALRRVVMGEDAVGTEANETQLAEMERLLNDALDAGAMGFSTSQAPTHNDGDGNPVPSRAATREELLRLAAVVSQHAGTQLELIIPGCLNGFTDDEVDLMARMSIAADRPLNWNVLGVTPGGIHEHQLDAGSRAAARGARVVALTLPQGMRIRLSFHSGFVLDGLPGWRETFALPIEERMAALSDPALRRRLDENAHSPEAGVLAGLARWERLEIVEGFTDDTKRLEGKKIGEIARARDAEPFDVLCDIVIADGLRTGLRPDFGGPEPDAVWKMRAAVWRDPRAIVGGSDAGAHLDMMSGASYSTFVVGDAVRNGHIELEEAVHLLSDVPARLYGVRDRGRIAVGAHADIVAFDPETVGPAGERTRDDLPGGASRIVADSRGVHHVLVAGTEIVHDGAYTGSTPGVVLRAGRDTDTVHPKEP
ncbi:MAG TPA: amidohydrolase family protein [Acidimicrobiia bacterium]|nr:amidohydrolase family protein [Acidimicrobiia bacterium]